jgi:hypothetical protein
MLKTGRNLKGITMTELKGRIMGRLAMAGLAIATMSLPAAGSLVGNWQFEEGSGLTVSDSSGQGNHGTLVNAKANTWTNGQSGGGLYFDGTTGAGTTYVTIPDAVSLHITNAVSKGPASSPTGLAPFTLPISACCLPDPTAGTGQFKIAIRA